MSDNTKRADAFHEGSPDAVDSWAAMMDRLEALRDEQTMSGKLTQIEQLYLFLPASVDRGVEE